MCYLRPQVLAVLEAAPDPADATAGDARHTAAELTATQFFAPLAEALSLAGDPARRAVRDEVGWLLEGTEDILVPLTLRSESGN